MLFELTFYFPYLVKLTSLILVKSGVLFMRLLSVVFMCLVISSNIVWADAQKDFQKGVKAYEQKNYATAFKLFKSLAEQGDENAQFNVGLLYESGLGVKQDHTKKIKWYTKAANQGVLTAQKKLGFIYQRGDGVKQDNVKALKWFMETAKRGDVDSQTVVGGMLLFVFGNGAGDQERRARASGVEWLQKAAKQGDQDALVLLKKLAAGNSLPSSSSSSSSSSKKQQYFVCIDACEADVKAQSDIACKSLSSTDGSSLGGYQTSSEGKCYDSFSSAKLACSTKCMP